jgi:acid phosphatase (class A)
MFRFATCCGVSGRTLAAVCSLLVGVRWAGLSLQAALPEGAPATGQTTNRVVQYVAPGAVDVRRVLPVPPATDSLADQADLETVLRIQVTRTPGDVELAERVASTDLGVIWPGFSNEAFPKTSQLLGEVFSDLALVLEEAKGLHQRPRPPKAHASVRPCLVVPGSFSYPSGHSTVGFVLAGFLSAIIPEKRDEVMERAHRFAWARIIGGVHYPSDVVGGRLLADAFLAQLLKNPDFLAQIPACRAELAANPARSGSLLPR